MRIFGKRLYGDILVADKGFYKRALAIAIPVTVQQVIALAVNLLDSIMLGKLEGSADVAISAASLGTNFFSLFMIFNFGLGGGLAMLCGQYWGRGDVESMRKAMAIIQRISLMFGVLFGAAALFGPRVIMEIMTSEQDVVEAGVEYLRWLSPAFLLFGVSSVTISVQRAMRNVKIAMIIQIITFLTNLVGNYILIFGKFGFPEMGVTGAAIATSIARIVEFIIVVIYTFRVDKGLSYKFRYLLHWDRDVFRAYLRGGVNVLVSDIFIGVGGLILGIIMGHMGKTMVTANSIANVVMQLSMTFNNGISSAGSILTANTVGAGEYDRAKREGTTMVIISLFAGIFAGILILLIRTPVISFYTGVSQEVKDVTYSLLNAIAVLGVFQTLSFILTKGVLRGGGDTRFLMIADVLFLWVLAIPLGALAGLVWGWAPWLVYCCLKCDEACKAIWCLGRLRSGKWIRNYASNKGVETA